MNPAPLIVALSDQLAAQGDENARLRSKLAASEARCAALENELEALKSARVTEADFERLRTVEAKAQASGAETRALTAELGLTDEVTALRSSLAQAQKERDEARAALCTEDQEHGETGGRLYRALDSLALAQAGAAVQGRALQTVATLLDSHQHAWEHEEGCDNDDADDCRACEYAALLSTAKAALSSDAGRQFLAAFDGMARALERIKRLAEAQPVHVCEVATFDLKTIAAQATDALSNAAKARGGA